MLAFSFNFYPVRQQRAVVVLAFVGDAVAVAADATASAASADKDNGLTTLATKITQKWYWLLSVDLVVSSCW